MIPIILAAVGGFIMLLGVGLMVGSVVAFVKPTKVVPGSNPEQKVPDYPVVMGLFVGGLLAIFIGKMIIGFINPLGKAKYAGHLARLPSRGSSAGSGRRRSSTIRSVFG